MAKANRELIERIEAAISRLEGKLDNHIYHLAKRPPWSVLIVVSILSSIVVGLAAALLAG